MFLKDVAHSTVGFTNTSFLQTNLGACVVCCGFFTAYDAVVFFVVVVE